MKESDVILAPQLNLKPSHKIIRDYYTTLQQYEQYAITHEDAVSSPYDPYVKAIRWASDRIGNEGVVAFVTNNGFLDRTAFDGMRKHLADDFDTIHILDLGGNVRENMNPLRNTMG